MSFAIPVAIAMSLIWFVKSAASVVICANTAGRFPIAETAIVPRLASMFPAADVRTPPIAEPDFFACCSVFLNPFSIWVERRIAAVAADLSV